jgi:ankyrin repeat protein
MMEVDGDAQSALSSSLVGFPIVTPLHLDALNGGEAFEALVKAGMPANTLDTFGETPLFCLLRSPSVYDSTVIRLLSMKEVTDAIDWSVRNSFGHTYIHAGVFRQNADILRLVFRASSYSSSVSVNAADSTGNTPLHLVVEKYLMRPLGKGSVEYRNASSIMELLAQYGANPTLENERGESVVSILFDCRARGLSYVTEMFVKAFPSLTSRSDLWLPAYQENKYSGGQPDDAMDY